MFVAKFSIDIATFVTSVIIHMLIIVRTTSCHGARVGAKVCQCSFSFKKAIV